MQQTHINPEIFTKMKSKLVEDIINVITMDYLHINTLAPSKMKNLHTDLEVIVDETLIYMANDIKSLVITE